MTCLAPCAQWQRRGLPAFGPAAAATLGLTIAPLATAQEARPFTPRDALEVRMNARRARGRTSGERGSRDPTGGMRPALIRT